jgi:hypothetical protein
MRNFNFCKPPNHNITITVEAATNKRQHGDDSAKTSKHREGAASEEQRKIN